MNSRIRGCHSSSDDLGCSNRNDPPIAWTTHKRRHVLQGQLAFRRWDLNGILRCLSIVFPLNPSVEFQPLWKSEIIDNSLIYTKCEPVLGKSMVPPSYHKYIADVFFEKPMSVCRVNFLPALMGLIHCRVEQKVPSCWYPCWWPQTTDIAIQRPERTRPSYNSVCTRVQALDPD